MMFLSARRLVGAGHAAPLPTVPGVEGGALEKVGRHVAAVASGKGADEAARTAKAERQK